MIKDWLPHLIVGLLALTAGAFGAWLLSSDDAGWETKENQILGGLEPEHGENSTAEARLPPRPWIAVSTFLFIAIGGFYVAAAMAGWVHRDEV